MVLYHIIRSFYVHVLCPSIYEIIPIYSIRTNDSIYFGAYAHLGFLLGGGVIGMKGTHQTI